MANIGADATTFESERPVIYALEEIEDATNNFDETRRIGVGGYGTVYFGMLEEKVCKTHLDIEAYFHVLIASWRMIAILTPGGCCEEDEV